jgi:hypothetical protein
LSVLTSLPSLNFTSSIIPSIFGSTSTESKTKNDTDTQPIQSCTQIERQMSFEKEINAMKEQITKFLKLHPTEDWNLMGSDHDIKVWNLKKETIKSTSVISDDDYAWPCIKSLATLDICAEELHQLLLDSTKAQLLSKYSAGRIDLHQINNFSKVVWHRTHFPYQLVNALDFVTLMHWYRHEHHPHSWIIVSKATDYPIASSFRQSGTKYTRSHILLNINILTPNLMNQSRTDLISINHVKWTGIPSFFAWRTAFSGTISYLRQLQQLAPSMNFVCRNCQNLTATTPDNIPSNSSPTEVNIAPEKYVERIDINMNPLNQLLQQNILTTTITTTTSEETSIMTVEQEEEQEEEEEENNSATSIVATRTTTIEATTTSLPKGFK